MRIIVVALFALILIFQIISYTEACKCCHGGCGCGGCGCGGCGGCGYGCGCGCGGYGFGFGGLSHHTVIREHSIPTAVQAAAPAPSVIGIPVLGSLGTKGCGCRGPCSCWD